MLPIVQKPNDIDLLCKVDVSATLDLLDKFPDRYWEMENARKENDYPVFHSTEHLILRFIEGAKDPSRFYENPAWALFAPTILPLMDQISYGMGIAQPIYPKAMFAKLKKNSRIDPHIDHGHSHRYVHKIHVPLISHPDICFLIKDEVFFLEPGWAYEVNNLVPHGVENPTSADRLHFIFEVYDQHDLTDLSP